MCELNFFSSKFVSETRSSWLYSKFRYPQIYFRLFGIVDHSVSVIQRTMKSLSSVCLSRLSNRQSVRPSLNFLKIWSLVFSAIVHDDSWTWYLVTNKARFLEKLLAARNLAKRAKIRADNRILLFSQVWFISFLLNCTWNIV